MFSEYPSSGMQTADVPAIEVLIARWGTTLSSELKRKMEQGRASLIEGRALRKRLMSRSGAMRGRLTAEQHRENVSLRHKMGEGLQNG